MDCGMNQVPGAVLDGSSTLLGLEITRRDGVVQQDKSAGTTSCA